MDSPLCGKATTSQIQHAKWRVAAPDLQFVNQWVALSGDQVIAHGPQGKIVYESARAKGIDSPFMFFVEEPNHTPFAGGWK